MYFWYVCVLFKQRSCRQAMISFFSRGIAKQRWCCKTDEPVLISFFSWGINRQREKMILSLIGSYSLGWKDDRNVCLTLQDHNSFRGNLMDEKVNQKIDLKCGKDCKFAPLQASITKLSQLLYISILSFSLCNRWNGRAHACHGSQADRCVSGVWYHGSWSIFHRQKKGWTILGLVGRAWGYVRI